MCGRATEGWPLDDPLAKHPTTARRRGFATKKLVMARAAPPLASRFRFRVKPEPGRPTAARRPIWIMSQRMRSHQGLPPVGPVALPIRSAPREPADCGGDCATRVAACEVDRTLSWTNPAASAWDFIELAWRRGLGRPRTAPEAALNDIRDRVRPGPYKNHVRERKIDQRTQSGMNSRQRREKFSCVSRRKPRADR